MSVYPPPLENTPIFNSQEFLIPLNATITVAEADAKYLARQDIAVSVAQTTSFTDNITIGNTILDYIPSEGLQIKPTVNSEAVFLRVLDSTGTTVQRVECNETNTFLYDQTRITQSATPTNYTSLLQTGAVMDFLNVAISSSFNFRTKGGAGSTTTPFSISSNVVTISPSQIATGLNGFNLNSALFGRNDTTANTFDGVLGYTRHPIGWTISASKAVAIPTSNVVVDVILNGTPTTVFNTLSNGVWRISCSCNNASTNGVITSITMAWGSPTGATIINGTTAQLYHQISAGLTNFAAPFPDLIIRTTGNGTTAIICNFTATYSAQPIVTFSLFATKIG